MGNPSDVNPRPRRLAWIAAFGLIAIMAGQVLFSVRSESQTWDEAYHVLAGYRYWQDSDFGINPEHPPLVKWVATIPLLFLQPPVPQIPQGTSKYEGFVAARKFLYTHDAEGLLFPCRVAASLFTLLLALLVFEAGTQMYGAGPGLLALILLVFEPNLLAHGALVTTDAGLACCFFAAVYAFYRYLSHPSALRVTQCGLLVGLTLAVKHSGILVLPALGLVALAECIVGKRAADPMRPVPETASRAWGRRVIRMAIRLFVIGIIALAVLWACYGLRFRARPGELKMTPSLAEYVRGEASPGLRNPLLSRLILHIERWRLLPESYLYGLADVLIVSAGPRPAFLFGKLYPTGKAIYFPAVFIIKSTLGFLVLLLLALWAKGLSSGESLRETLFLTIPPAFYFATSLATGLNVGVRHILPVYPFLLLFVAAAAWKLLLRRRRWTYAIAGLVALHVVSSLRTYPNYLAYSNEIWGGPAKTYRVLTDSNADWGQELKAVKHYLEQTGTTECWLAYFGSADPDAYHLPCKLLPDVFAVWWGKPIDVVPEIVEGTILIGATPMAGVYYGPGELNPYDQFLRARPVANLGGGILVYKGRFDLRIASQWSHLNRAWQLLGAHQLDQAIAEARIAVARAPRMVYAHYTLAYLAMEAGKKQEALQEYKIALALARSIYPEYQWFWIPFLQAKVEGR